jgi:hypothetical protein
MRTYLKVKQVINNATATIESAGMDAGKASKISFVFKRTNHTAGQTVFTVQVCPESENVPDADSNWITYARLITNVANTNAESIVRANGVTITSSTTPVLVSMSPEDVVGKVRVVATETTDGTHNAWVMIQYGS